MRSLLLAVMLMSWACAEPRQYTQPRPTADATGEEAATLVEAPGDREREEEQEEEQEEEEPEEPTPAPVKPFSYDKWTAEPPTRGEPKIPGPPFPHVEAEGKKGLYERIRRLRWDIWPMDRVLFSQEAWVKNWEEWIEDGHLATAVAQPDAVRFCYPEQPPGSLAQAPHIRLRANDPTLRKLLDEYRIAYPLWHEHKNLPDEEINNIREEISIFDTGAANYFFKLVELRENINTKNRMYFNRANAVTRKIQQAYGCSIRTHFNSCWLPYPGLTVRRLIYPRCADQR